MRSVALGQDDTICDACRSCISGSRAGSAQHEKIIRKMRNLKIYSLLLTVAFVSCFPAPVSANSKTKADEQAGAVLFRDKGCAHCHGADLAGTKKAPALPATLRKDKQWTPEKLTRQILDGGQKMPPFSDSLSDAEVAQLVAYLRAKHRPIPASR